jgi:curved DNA-binding protein CbpA
MQNLNDMQNLYDLLGVRPDEDAGNLRKAFREAAKASHPDHHGSDPEAAVRFTRIVHAYDTLRDAEKRAAYDQLLETQRRPLRAKLKRTISDLKRHIVTDVTVAVVLTIILAGGYELLVRMSETPIPEAGGMMAGESAEAAVIQPGDQSDDAGRDRLAGARAPQMPVLMPEVSGDESAANERSGALEMAKGEPVPDLAVQTIEVVRGDSELEVPINQAATKASADDAEKNQAGEPPAPQAAPSGDVASSASEKPDGGQHVPSFGVATSDIKDDSKTPEPAGVTAGDAKHAAEMRGAVRPLVAAKRRLPLQQASLESRNASSPVSRNAAACAGSQSCTGDRLRGDQPPPVFGVGF